MWGLIYTGTFLLTFAGSIITKVSADPTSGEFSVNWNDSVGMVQKDLSYGDGPAQKFDLYLPADHDRKDYGLVVYLHAGGFTSGDKADDSKILEWLCSQGYVAAGINYTLFGDENPQANVHTQSVEIRDAIPCVIQAADDAGYHIHEMAVGGGSAGGALALLYAYRDASLSPVPVKFVFEAVGPSSFYPEDWKSYGFDQHPDAAAGLFSVMTGKQITPDMFGTPDYDELVKDASSLLWIDQNTVPSLLAYGKYDKVQPYEASVRLDQKLSENNVPHDYIVMEHSGHGLQNDSKEYVQYMRKIKEYLQKYIPLEN